MAIWISLLVTSLKEIGLSYMRRRPNSFLTSLFLPLHPSPTPLSEMDGESEVLMWPLFPTEGCKTETFGGTR